MEDEFKIRVGGDAVECDLDIAGWEAPDSKRRGVELGIVGRATGSVLDDSRYAVTIGICELDPSVADDPAFAAVNPRWNPEKLCIYIGMSSLTPEERCSQHLNGTKNVSRIEHKYGLRLRMDLVPLHKPTRRTWAMKLEVRLAKSLRSQGFGTWMV